MVSDCSGCRQLTVVTKSAAVHTFIFTFITSKLDYCHFLDRTIKASQKLLLVKHTAAFLFNKNN